MAMALHSLLSSHFLHFLSFHISFSFSIFNFFFNNFWGYNPLIPPPLNPPMPSHTSTIILLLMAGDVEFNLGPNYKVPCGDCGSRLNQTNYGLS